MRGGDQVAQVDLGDRHRRLVRAPASASATRAICRPATPISCSRRSAKSWASSASLRSRLSTPRSPRAGLRIALRAATDYGFFLATAVTLFLAIPGRCDGGRASSALIPLTGVVTPFLSYGGSAMVANFAALGDARGDSTASGSRRHDVEPFRRPTQCARSARWRRAAVVLLVVMTQRRDRQRRRATSSGRTSACRPTASAAISTTRACWTSRAAFRAARSTTAAACRLRPATRDVLGRARAEYAKLGIAHRRGVRRAARALLSARRRRPSTSSATRRAASTGARRTPRTSSATPTRGCAASTTTRRRSSTERPADRRCRRSGATIASCCRCSATATSRPSGRARAPRATARRPPDDRCAAAGPRGAPSSQGTRRKSTTGRAAAVVLDPDTGDLLAAASYPLPYRDGAARSAASDVDAALLDRARYGLYPPGSTFKLVTAAAALETGPRRQQRRRSPAAYLPDGRVGARIPGWSRPVRDDVLDTRPHGTLDMHGGLVHSCNAYFAQLAVRVGARGADGHGGARSASRPRRRVIGRSACATRCRRRATGRATSSPRRCAWRAWRQRWPTAGVLRDVSLGRRRQRRGGRRTAVSAGTRGTARALHARRVLSGTGRTLRGHPLRIAGKTGTAEVSGAASHSWFVGFAPFDAAARRIAFAVIVENAGYGWPRRPLSPARSSRPLPNSA